MSQEVQGTETAYITKSKGWERVKNGTVFYPYTVVINDETRQLKDNRDDAITMEGKKQKVGSKEDTVNTQQASTKNEKQKPGNVCVGFQSW